MLRDSFQVEENEDYAMGVPLKSINLGVEQPKPGDVAITAAHRAKRGIFSQCLGCFVDLQIHTDLHIFGSNNFNDSEFFLCLQNVCVLRNRQLSA